MNLDPHQTALMTYLDASHKGYYGKVLELRTAVEGWLGYIPQTFPHYTRHTIKHSEEIVVQLSKLLFKNDDPKQPVTQLSPAEAYILIAAAYLHDAGMVVADKEKLEILTSNPEWKNWISGEGGGAKRWREIEDLRRGNNGLDETARHFVADLQTRFLIAEFIRRAHHLRAADVIKQYENHLGHFAFGDRMMQRTIADICVSHGLRHYELEDKEKFPEKRDIQGYSVNVRLLAILLRLGDLLDMSYDRACPMLMNAASPLPADSYAHWEQYNRITHRSTSPNRIEVIAECEKQEEHRVLQDWCQWIVDEVREAKILMSRAELHKEWQPPAATMDTPDATITIRPAPDAKYIPSKWTFELDNEAVFQRLVRDVYDDPIVFIRELIQNALDANRSQMYADLMKAGIEPPEYPTQVEEERRQRYPVQVRLEVRKVKNKYSEEEEDRQVLIIDDAGIGMDREIIKKYFLQVGRSYYTTDEFRRKFRFTATSRFGVGFLSTFAVSDNVTVDTYKPDSPQRDEPIRLILTGPRNYLLTEKSERLASGTRIEVELRDALPQGKLTELVTNWCRRVEFPIFVDDLGTQARITAEGPEQFVYETPNVSSEGEKFVVRSFPSNIPGVEGEFYVFVSVEEDGERWDMWSYATKTYPTEHPQASKPTMPSDLICLHGISLTEEDYQMFRPQQGFSVRLDYRGSKYNPTLSRTSREQDPAKQYPEMVDRWNEILLEHLTASVYANADNGWEYKQQLAATFFQANLWDELPETIPLYQGKTQRLFSMRDMQKETTLMVITDYNAMNFPHIIFQKEELEAIFVKFADEKEIDTEKVMFPHQMIRVSYLHRKKLFEHRKLTNIKWVTPELLRLTWTLCEDKSQIQLGIHAHSSLMLAKIPFHNVIGFRANMEDPYIGSIRYVNDEHEFTGWLKRVDEASRTSLIKRDQFLALIDLVRDAIEYRGDSLSKLNSYLEKWLEIEDLPAELYPPLKEITPEMLTLKKYGE